MLITPGILDFYNSAQNIFYLTDVKRIILLNLYFYSIFTESDECEYSIILYGFVFV
jgi:hypothetical protein